MSKPSVSSQKIQRWIRDHWEAEDDLLASEEPMEIRIEYGPEVKRIEKSLSVTMRTPGNDFELAIGFLVSEGMIQKSEDVISVRYCLNVSSDHSLENIVRVRLNPHLEVNLLSLERNYYASSSCGICGKASLEALHSGNLLKRTNDKNYSLITPDFLLNLPGKLRDAQHVFNRTGGIHACTFFNTSGRIVYTREDIGRHNALDKMIGAAFADNSLPLNNGVLLLSGRAGYEMIQKAAAAGINFIASIGAPTSLAVQAAIECGITLVGFLRDQRFNVYCGIERIKQ